MATWIKSGFKGVYYREHPERKHGRTQKDKYWSIKHCVDGRQIHEGIGWSSEGWTDDEANRIRSELQRNKKNGIGPVSYAQLREQNEAAAARSESDAIRTGTTMADLADRYVAWAKTVKKTWADDEGRLRLHVLPVLGDVRIQDVTRAHVDKLRVATEAKGLAPATVVQVLALVRALFNYAMDAPVSEKDLSPLFSGANPARLSRSRSGRGVRLPKVDNARLRVLTEDEAVKLLEAASEVSPALHDLCLIALDTGLRLGEAVGIRSEYVLYEGSTLHIVDSKGRNRTVYPDKCREMLVGRAKAGAYLFPGKKSAPHMLVTSVARPFNKAADLAGLNDGVEDPRMKLTYHCLRHTYATWLYVRERDLHLVQKMLGHRDISTTEKYVHLAQAFIARAALGRRGGRG